MIRKIRKAVGEFLVDIGQRIKPDRDIEYKYKVLRSWLYWQVEQSSGQGVIAYYSKNCIKSFKINPQSDSDRDQIIRAMLAAETKGAELYLYDFPHDEVIYRTRLLKFFEK